MAKEAPHIVVAFGTTADAMGFQALAANNPLLTGRLAPIPRQISAGCGFAWREPAENEAALRQLLNDSETEYETIVLLDL